jgi:hypothetical protein
VGAKTFFYVSRKQQNHLDFSALENFMKEAILGYLHTDITERSLILATFGGGIGVRDDKFPFYTSTQSTQRNSFYGG